MRIELSRNSKRLIGFVAVVLAVLVCSGDTGCDPGQALGCDQTKEEQFPGFWVSCVDNQPTLMTYNGDHAITVSNSQAGQFNPTNYDCTHPNSPAYKGSEAAPFPTASPSGPASNARVGSKAQAATVPAPSVVAYLPQLLRDLPFVPAAPPPAAACNSSFRDVFQVDHNTARIARFSTCPFQLKATVGTVTRPLQMQITPDGSTALVTSFDNAVNFIDVNTNTSIFTLTTDPTVTPNGLAISPDGTKAYITSYSMTNPEVLEIDLTTRQIIAKFPTSFQWPQSVTFTPDGSQIWVNTDSVAPDTGVDVFDTLTNTRVTTLNITMPTDIAFNSKGTVAYITSSGNTPGQVIAIDTATFQTLKTYTVGPSPADIAMSYGDQYLVVNNSDGTVSVIDLAKQTVSSAKIGSSAVSGIVFVK